MATDSNLKNDSDNMENMEIGSTDEDDSKNTGGSSGKKRSLPASEEEKKAERRAANRRSAFQSRQRRKILIEDLQRTVAGLSKENTDLRKSNEDLRVQLKAILLENHQLRIHQQIHGSSVGAADLMQASALLRGGAGNHNQQSAIAQLLGAGAGGVTGHGQLAGVQASTPADTHTHTHTPITTTSTASTSAANGENADALLNSRLALAAAEARADELGQSHDGAASTNQSTAPQSSAPSSSNTPGNSGASIPGMTENQSLGLQSLLESAAARQSGLQNSLNAGHQFNVLQGLLENSTYSAGAGAGVPGGAIGGLAALYDQVSRPNVGQMGGAAAGLNDIQRALLAGASGSNSANLSSLAGAPTSGANNGNDNTVSDALRNLLQKNPNS